MWVYISIILLIFIYLTYKAYIKIKYPFWSRLPLYHSYNFFNIFYKQDIISNDALKLDKFLNIINIKNTLYTDLTTNDKTSIFKFIKDTLSRSNVKPTTHVNNNGLVCIPTINKIYAHYTSELYSKANPCFINIYYERQYDNIIIDNAIIGVIMSRPLYFKLNHSFFTTYYVENLTINADNNANILSPELIYSILQCQYKQKINTALFKREGVFNIPVKPLISYDAFLFDMSKWNNSVILPSVYQIREINSKTFYKLKDVLQKSIHDLFPCIIIPSFAMLHELVKTSNIFIYSVSHKDDILGIYIFKEATKQFHGKKIIECIASVNQCDISQQDIFIVGFKEVLTRLRNAYPMIIINNISHNSCVISKIMIQYKPLDSIIQHLFMYNYIHPKLSNNDCFILS